MKSSTAILASLLGLFAYMLLSPETNLPPGVSHQLQAEETLPEKSAEIENRPTTIVEARSRARLLHETIHGALQVMHRDFFDDESPDAIPSASLDDVFAELAETYGVQVSWLTVETDLVNVDHKPDTPFEIKAVEVLKSGAGEFESSNDQGYHFAGAIQLSSQCLKCHVRSRTSTEDRTAGLVISMPLRKP